MLLNVCFFNSFRTTVERCGTEEYISITEGSDTTSIALLLKRGTWRELTLLCLCFFSNLQYLFYPVCDQTHFYSASQVNTRTFRAYHHSLQMQSPTVLPSLPLIAGMSLRCFMDNLPQAVLSVLSSKHSNSKTLLGLQLSTNRVTVG